jgi:DNA adenine methylase
VKFLSPLRYPGGKAKMTQFLEGVIRLQSTPPSTYAEPYAGGAGAALHLLSQGVVERIALNDLNDGIAAFWRSVFYATDRLVAAITSHEVTLDEWHRQRETYLDEAAEPFDRGFATFFLNRTNRSGILGARPIGGLEQTGNWRLDARFNKRDLVERIRYLSTFSSKVDVSQEDGVQFLERLNAELDGRCLFYVDPPYIKQGESLYLANMTYRDHVTLAGTLQRLRSPWILTYDHDDRVPDELYAGLACAAFSVSHTAAKQHLGNEYLVVPDHVRVSSLDGFGPRPGVWLTGRSPAELGA